MSILDTEIVIGNNTGLDLTEAEEHFAELLRSTHIVAPSDNPSICKVLGNGPELTAQDIVNWAREHRFEVKALCGYKWVPLNNPEKYDLCELCRLEAEKRMREHGE